MANGQTVRRFVDFENDAEVPFSNVVQTPAGHYVIIAQVTPTFQYQKLSMESLVAYLEGALPLAQGLLSEQTARQLIAAEVERLKAGQETQDTNIQQNAGGVTSLQNALNELSRRVTTLEQGSGGTSHQDPHAGNLRYGVREHDGTARRSTQVHFPGVPISQAVVFSGAQADTDEWFFEVPKDTRITHIINVGPLGNQEELGTALWQVEPPTLTTPRIYAFVGGISVPATARYQIGLERVPIRGTVMYSLRETDGTTVRGAEHDKEYPDLPVTLTLSFPQAVATTDKLYFVVPERASVDEIQQGNSVVTGDWAYDATTRTWAFTTGLTVGVATEITVSLIEETGG